MNRYRRIMKPAGHAREQAKKQRQWQEASRSNRWMIEFIDQSNAWLKGSQLIWQTTNQRKKLGKDQGHDLILEVIIISQKKTRNKHIQASPLPGMQFKQQPILLRTYTNRHALFYPLILYFRISKSSDLGD